ncbi:hypothetical protein KM043_015702 [Ampulex compressa]|nr:hypothetical protein KM043_015702 [Ampulex compressa]
MLSCKQYIVFFFPPIALVARSAVSSVDAHMHTSLLYLPDDLSRRICPSGSYLVAGGLIESVSRHKRALIETDFFLDQEHESLLLVSSFELLSRICKTLGKNGDQENSVQQRGIHTESNNIDQTSSKSHLLSSFLSTEAAGTIGALYAAVALTPQNQKASSPTPNQTTLTATTRTLVVRGVTLLRSIAELDLDTLQLLGAEGTSLQWRLLASHLITRLSRDPISDKKEAGTTHISGTYILSELFQVLGYFAVNNPENQLVLQTAGAGPSVLQQLCTLPFLFYADPSLTAYTLPTLLAATHDNPEAVSVLSCELSYQLLEEYKCSSEGKLNSLVRLLKDEPSP